MRLRSQFPGYAEIQPHGFSRYLSGRSQWKPAAAHSCWWASKDKTVQSASSLSWGSRYHWISLGCSLHPTKQKERRQKFSDQTQINHPSERWWPEKIKKKIKEIKDMKELQFTSLSDRHLCGPNKNCISQPLGLTSKSYICLCSYDTWQYLKNDFSLWKTTKLSSQAKEMNKCQLLRKISLETLKAFYFYEPSLEYHQERDAWHFGGLSDCQVIRKSIAGCRA